MNMNSRGELGLFVPGHVEMIWVSRRKNYACRTQKQILH